MAEDQTWVVSPLSHPCLPLSVRLICLNRSFGEVGFYILSNCLIRLFPNHVFPPGSTHPLSVANFRLFILLPEVAVHLIMQDLDQDRATAIVTLRSSMRYGDSKFVLDPDDEPSYDLLLSNVLRETQSLDPTCVNTAHIT